MSAATLKIRPEVDEGAAATAHRRLGAIAAAPALALQKATSQLQHLGREASGLQRRISALGAAALAPARGAGARLLRELDQANARLRAGLGLGVQEVRAIRAEYERAGRALAPVVRALSAASRTGSALASRVVAATGSAVGGAARGLGRAAGGAAREVGVGAARYVGELGVRAVGGVLGRAAGAAESVRASADTAAKSYLGPEAYGRLGLAAKLSGTEIGKVQESVIKLEGILSKKVSPEVGVALKAIGVSAKDLRGLSPEAQLGAIGDGLAKIEDPADRAIVAQRLLGESAAKDLLPFLSLGTQGLGELGDKAQRLGLVFDKDTAAASERLGDAQDLLGMRIDGLVNKIGAKLIPKIEVIVTSVDAWLEANSELVETKILEWVDNLTAGAEALWAKLSEVDWTGMADDASAVVDVVADLVVGVQELLPELDASDVALAGIGVRVAALLGPMGLLAAAAAAAGYAIGAAFAEGNTALETALQKVTQIRAVAERKALEDVMASRGDAEKNAVAEKAGTQRGIAASDRAVAAMSKHGKVDYAVVAQVHRLAKSSKREDQRQAEELIRGLERSNRPGTGTGGKKGKGGRLNLEAPSGKKEVSAAQADVDSEIAKYAAEAGRLEYTAAIQRGESAAAADRAARAREAATKKDLAARAPGLVAAGTLGAGAGSMFGRPTTLGGALPISLDLGPKAGGPPPIQVIQVTTPNVTVDVSMAGAKVDADLRQIRESVVAATARELGATWRSAIAEVAPTIVR